MLRFQHVDFVDSANKLSIWQTNESYCRKINTWVRESIRTPLHTFHEYIYVDYTLETRWKHVEISLALLGDSTNVIVLVKFETYPKIYVEMTR